ncbi:zinc finger CCCH domain-containing protein 6-like [Salvia miltiorrhiza]|uniref:zinc finger CCCH domain-containing protein 6-like n=1 Tax=Salvia miltiorrhiza TaxID=226208 RepID=UPI0025AC8FBE|nr:zinc finger CCCH domain-containing protein 6-like [Salvia miltiorrhiza]
MKDSTKKSTRVSPSQAADLRQAKSLLPEDQPARVKTKSQPSCSNVVRSKNHLAWYVALNTKQLEKKISHIPQIKWKCPPKFALNTGWHVVSGEESQEAEAQKCTESADLTTIPPCLFTPLLVEVDCHDNSETPIIPIIPIEEMAAEMPFDTSGQPLASCPSVSGDLPVSQSDPSESEDQSVHGKSLPHILHGLESGDLEIAVAAAATVAAVMKSKDHIDTGLLIKFLSDPKMIKKLMNGNGLTSKLEDEAPPAPKAITSLPLPSSTPANETVSKAILFNSTTEPLNQSSILPCSKVETDIIKATSKPSGAYAGNGPTHASKAAKKMSQSPRFISSGPTKKFTACSHTQEQKVRPLVPSTLRPDEKTIDRLLKKYGSPDNTIDRLLKKYGGPDITGVKPVDSLNPSTSMLNLETMKTMIDDYGAPDVVRVKPMVSLVASNSVPPNIREVRRKPSTGPSPPLLASTASPPVTNLHALPIDATGNFRPSYTPMAIPAREVGLQYHKSLIKHGKIHETEKDKVPKICQSGNYLQGLEQCHKITKIETNPKYWKPCLYFTSSRGCRNGHNCPFQHDVPKQWRATSAVEAPINPVAIAPVAKRMKLNEQFQKWHYL